MALFFTKTLSLPVLVGGAKSLRRPFYLCHVPLSVLMAGRGDLLSEGGGDGAAAVPDRLLQEPPAGREPRGGPLRLDGRGVRQRGEGGVDGQRSSEVNMTVHFRGNQHSEFLKACS